MAMATLATVEGPPSLDDPSNDQSFLESHRDTVYLATINLAVSDAVSNMKSTAF